MELDLTTPALLFPAQATAISLASPSDIEQTVRRLAAMREAFLTTGATGALQPRSLIGESWRRCQALHVDAGRRLAQFGASDDGQLAVLRARNELLLGSAQAALARLRASLGDAGYVVVLSDAQGNLLEIGGELERRRQVARNGMLPGSNWSEAAAGTNAIGTAIATGRVVQLLAAEHYCAGLQDITCTAAPIHHPDSGALVGVLDITGDYRMIRPFLTGLLAVAALDVQRGYARALHGRPAAPASPPRAFAGAALPAALVAEEAHGSHGASPAADAALNVEYARRADAAERLAAAAGAISASLDLDLTLETVAAQVGRVLDLPCAAVALREGPEGPLSRAWQPRAAGGHLPARAISALLREPIAAAWCESGAPTLFAEPARMPPEVAAIVAPAGIRALALLPLVTARGVLGLIVAARTRPGPWDVDDLRLGLALAAHAATAIENARLFTALRSYAAHTEALNALAVFLSRLLDPGQQLDLVLRRVAEITDLDAGLILLHDAPDAPLMLAAAHGLPAADPELPGELRGLAEAAHRGGLPILLCRHEEREGHPLFNATGLCDLLAVPLTMSAASMGVLVVGSRRHRQIGREELTLFSTIAQQLGLALSSARLRRAASENAALREADRLKSIFLASVSHDLRSPLTAIRASVEGLLERPGAPAPEADGLLQNIARQASRLGRFVDQLLDLSRIEAGSLAVDREWVEVAALLDDLLVSFRQRSPGCPIERAISPDLPLLYLDPALAAQVLWNLLENAQKYGPPGGAIRVEAFCTGPQVLISVADRGPGVAAAERTKIFDHFFRLDRDRRAHIPGSGLGLAICRGIVEAHGGQIWVDERPGGGSVFRVALPLASPDLADLERADAPLGLARGAQ
jgi:signal transduction histidine kinase